MIPRGPSQACRTVKTAVSELEPISLEKVNSEAALHTRVDKKFLLAPAELSDLVDALTAPPDAGFRVLQIDDRRVFGYESIYFDTPQFGQFHAHRQGRRRRFKVRTRTYADSGECMLEAKLKGYRGATVKHRMPYRRADRARLTAEAERFLEGRLSMDYRMPLPHLVTVLRTDYARATLVDPVRRERITCDVDLVCADARASVVGPDLVIVETKSADGRGAADRALARLGIRPVSMSKYCLGIALLHPELPANPWSRLLLRDFGWQRRLETDPAFS